MWYHPSCVYSGPIAIIHTHAPCLAHQCQLSQRVPPKTHPPPPSQPAPGSSSRTQSASCAGPWPCDLQHGGGGRGRRCLQGCDRCGTCCLLLASEGADQRPCNTTAVHGSHCRCLRPESLTPNADTYVQSVMGAPHHPHTPPGLNVETSNTKPTHTTYTHTHTLHARCLLAHACSLYTHTHTSAHLG